MDRDNWNKENTIQESKKYFSRSEFALNAKSAYSAALRNGWLEEMVWFKTCRRRMWTKEEVIEEAKKYTTLKDFSESSYGAYQSALRNGWLTELGWLRYGHQGWTVKTVIIESKKYKTRTEFSKKCKGAYMFAKRNGILEDMHWLPLKVRSRWTKEECVAESKKYTTKKEFSENSIGAYSAAKKNGWLDGMTWLSSLVHPAWSKEECMEIGKNFQKGASGAYQAARSNGWLDEMPWLKTPVFGELQQIGNHCVYAYIDEDNKACYIGRTNRLIKRDKEHRHTSEFKKADTIKAYFDSIGKEIPHYIVLKDNLLPAESQYWEDYFVKDYYQNGYKIINKAKTGINIGSLGGGYIKWDKKSTILESKKYHTFGDFAKNSASAYQAALYHDWLKEMHWLTYEQMPSGYWTKERVIEESRKYSTRAEMEKYSLGAYSAALKNGWSSELPLEYQRAEKNYYTKETIFKLSKECTSRGEFKQKYSRAYVIARQSKWLDDMPWLIPQRKKWSKETVLNESKKYKTVTEFRRNCWYAYNVAFQNEWLIEMIWFKHKNRCT